MFCLKAVLFKRSSKYQDDYILLRLHGIVLISTFPFASISIIVKDFFCLCSSKEYFTNDPHSEYGLPPSVAVHVNVQEPYGESFKNVRAHPVSLPPQTMFVPNHLLATHYKGVANGNLSLALVYIDNHSRLIHLVIIM